MKELIKKILSENYYKYISYYLNNDKHNEQKDRSGGVLHNSSEDSQCHF